MKKILSILFALALTAPVFGQLQTNKINNTAMLLDNGTVFKMFNATFVVTNSTFFNKFAYFNAGGVMVGTNAPSGGGGNVFLASNNTYTVTSVNTFQTNTYFYQPGASVRVGINTNVPAAILDIHSGGDTNAAMVRIVGGPNRNGPYLDITNTAMGSIFLVDKFGSFGSLQSSATNSIAGTLLVGASSTFPATALYAQAITSNQNAFVFRGITGQTSNLVTGLTGGGVQIFTINSTGSQMNWGTGLGGQATASTITLTSAGGTARIQQGSGTANSKMAIDAGGSSGAALLFEASGLEVGRWTTNSLNISNSTFVAANALATHQIGSLSIIGLNIFGSGNGINVGGGGSGAVTLHPSGSNPVLVRGFGMTITNSLVVSNSLLVANGTTTIGTNGSAMVFIKTATASLDYPSILAAGSADLTITVGGANTNDIVTLGRPFDEDASLATLAFVSAIDTVTVRAHNVGSLAVDQAAKTYRVEVTHY